MNTLKVANYTISEPAINIINKLKVDFPKNKLHDITVKSDEIILTCVNSNHANGNEAHPDAHINLDPRRATYLCYHCFACDTVTDFVGFIALYLDSSREFAKDWLVSNFGDQIEDHIKFDDEIILNKKSINKFLPENILDSYSTWTPYFAKRKLTQEVCNNFKLRYDPTHRQVIIPIRDINGNLKMLARRSIDTKTFYMDAGQEKEVFGLNIIQKNNIHTCIIAEGPFDMLSGWTNGIPAIATLGAISDYQIEQINKSCIKFLYTAFDHDNAGEHFASVLKNKLDPRIIITELDFNKSKKDLNELDAPDWQDIIKKYFLK